MFRLAGSIERPNERSISNLLDGCRTQCYYTQSNKRLNAAGGIVRTIAIVGAGAKAAAIVARAATLRNLGVKEVPNIVVFEAHRIGAAWNGDDGFTSGTLQLCTPGERDVGFPYRDKNRRPTIDVAIAPAIYSRFSWGSYLVAVGGMSQWVDRGRNYPSHRSWASYLEWVFRQSEQSVIIEKVVQVRSNGGRWIASSTSRSVDADGVVLTGTGRARTIPCSPSIPAGRVLDAESFWIHRNQFLQLEEATIAVVGAGGGAGTIVSWLVERIAERVSVVSISPRGALFSRSDGYAERAWFSDPEGWDQLSIDHKRAILERTEAGVVSAHIRHSIDQSDQVAYLSGRATRVTWNGEDEEIQLDTIYDGKAQPPLMADYVVNATGFDSWSLLDVVDSPVVRELQSSESSALRLQVEQAVGEDLALPPVSGIPGGIHVPALAGLSQGPGMPNLGCLGLMAAAILQL